tara:strand:+ start:2232 stop:2474 length:243 start_codon:yes stop_codon:yes gene_type:complete
MRMLLSRRVIPETERVDFLGQPLASGSDVHRFEIRFYRHGKKSSYATFPNKQEWERNWNNLKEWIKQDENRLPCLFPNCY